MSNFEIDSEQKYFPEIQSFESLEGHLGKKEENSEFINSIDNNLAESHEDFYSLSDEAKKSHNPLQNFKSNELGHINCHDNKTNTKDNIFNSCSIDNPQNYSQKESDNLGLVNKRNSQNLEKNSKINNDNSINYMLFKNINDNSFASDFKNLYFTEKFSPIFSDESFNKIETNLYNKNDFLDNTDNTTYHCNNKNNCFSSKPNLNSQFDCQNDFALYYKIFANDNANLNIMFDIEKKSIDSDINEMKKFIDIEYNNNELKNNPDTLPGNANYNTLNNNHNQRSDKHFLNKKKNLPNDNNNYNENNNKIFIIKKLFNVFNIQVYKKIIKINILKNFLQK